VMKNVLHRAEILAQEARARFTTGHVLLSLVLNNGAASKLLHNLGLNESRVRGYLREGYVESSSAMSRLIKGTDETVAAVKALSTTEMHLLAAAFKMKQSVISDIFSKAGVDVGAAHVEVMHRMTAAGSHRTHRSRSVSRPAVNADYQQALPLPDALSGFSVKRPKLNVLPSAVDLPAKQSTLSPDARRRAQRMMSIGSEIEQKQRLKRTEKAGAPDAVCEAECDMQSPPLSASPRASRGMEASASFFVPDKQRFALLSQIGRNLVQEAAEGAFDEIVPRVAQTERIAEVLHKRRANCPCIVGPAGVGKTALVEGFAAAAAKGEEPFLAGKALIEIRPADLLAGTGVRGALAERIGGLRQEVAAAQGRVILFFDEFAALLGSNDGMEAVQEIKAALGKGELPCIAVASDEDYARYIESDPTLARRFTKVELAEPDEQEATVILRSAAVSYARHHEVAFEEEALEAAVRLSSRYLHDRALPDKALALIDTAGARARRRGASSVTQDDIAHVAAEQIGVAPERLTAGDHERLLSLEAVLGENIIGHRHVLSAVAETLRRNAAGFRSGRPIGSFLFLGPTGVGKTETAKTLGDFLFPDNGAFIRLDMSEFSEAHAVARLLGAPPGYVGHEEGGQLTEAVRRRPYSLVLLDEIEKAHPEVLQVLLQILDDGRLTDGLGRTVPFENTIIIMTGNLGCNLSKYKRQVGFGASRSVETVSDISADVISAMRAALPPELWNRMDEVLVFNPLDRQEVLDITALMLARVGRQLLGENGIRFEADKETAEYLAAAGGFDPEFGARPMRRVVQRLVEGPIAKMILEGAVTKGDTIVGFVKDNVLAFKKAADA
jgi:ATP-dependent Clp protease ATP-binding subunit ClpC